MICALVFFLSLVKQFAAIPVTEDVVKSLVREVNVLRDEQASLIQQRDVLERVVRLEAQLIRTDDRKNPCVTSPRRLLRAAVTRFGNDCPFWSSLFTADGRYAHAHAGFKTGPSLIDGCTGYANFCPRDRCSFQVAGEPILTPVGDECHMLVPYLWAQVPAQAGSLEPHNGWEYIIAVPDLKSPVGYAMKLFAEIETTFSVPFNWVSPADATGERWKVDALKTFSGASAGECDNDLQPMITEIMGGLTGSSGSALFRQQGDAVVLAVGGQCTLVVPYAAEDNGDLEEGKFVMIFEPNDNGYVQKSLVKFTSVRV